VTNEFRFEIVETFKDVRYRYGILTVSKLNTMFVVFAVNAGVDMFDETFRLVTLAKGVTNEFRFEIVETFRDPTLAEGVTRELRFETDETFRVPALTDETEIDDGKSELSSARNVGAPEPDVGPAKTVFWAEDVAPVPPDVVSRGVPRVKVSTDAPSTTVKAYPGLEAVCTATLPYPSMTIASCV
jgi:hypothetical protein